MELRKWMCPANCARSDLTPAPFTHSKMASGLLSILMDRRTAGKRLGPLVMDPTLLSTTGIRLATEACHKHRAPIIPLVDLNDGPIITYVSVDHWKRWDACQQRLWAHGLTCFHCHHCLQTNCLKAFAFPLPCHYTVQQSGKDLATSTWDEARPHCVTSMQKLGMSMLSLKTAPKTEKASTSSSNSGKPLKILALNLHGQV